MYFIKKGHEHLPVRVSFTHSYICLWPSFIHHMFNVPVAYWPVHHSVWLDRLLTCTPVWCSHYFLTCIFVLGPHCLLISSPVWGTPIVYLLVHLFEVSPLFTYLYTCLRYPHPIVYLLVHLFEVPLRHDDLSSTALHGLSNEHTHFVPLLLNFADGVLDLVCVLLTDLLWGVLITAVFTSVGVRTGHL